MHAFDVLGDPVRRRIIELIADQELAAGQVTEVIMKEFEITQPAVSRHLRILRENGFAAQRSMGTRRLYALKGDGLDSAKEWIAEVEAFWTPALDALHTEIARQNRTKRIGRSVKKRPTTNQ